MPTWQRALQLRSEALDRQYGPTSVTPTWQKALQFRSEALDRQYGLGKVGNETTNSGWYTGLEQTRSAERDGRSAVGRRLRRQRT